VVEAGAERCIERDQFLDETRIKRSTALPSRTDERSRVNENAVAQAVAEHVKRRERVRARSIERVERAFRPTDGSVDAFARASSSCDPSAAL
jgi:hypothetical protein